jgi:hypothetical protein
MVSILSLEEINQSIITPLSTLVFDILKQQTNNFEDLKNSELKIDNAKLATAIEQTIKKI